jgi:tetratricopeptide (TPR) repeat protein
MKKLILVPVMVLAAWFTGLAQSGTLSNLFKQLDTTNSDTGKALICYSISRLYWERNADSVLLMSTKALEISEKAHYAYGMALADLSKGVAFGLKEQFPESLDAYLQALRIAERKGMEVLTANLYEDIAIVYDQMDDLNKAKGYYFAALQIAEKNADQHEMAICFINLSELLKKKGAYDSAISYNGSALAIMEAFRDSVSVSAILLNTGDDYNKKGQPELGLTYFRKCSAIAERIHDEQDIAWANLSTAQSYLQENKCDLSIQYATIALGKAKKIAFSEIISASYSILYADYRCLGKFAKALDYRNLEIALRDSIYTIEKDKKIKNLESGYQLEKKQNEIELLNKDKLIQQQDLARERQWYIMCTAGALFSAIWAFFLFKSNQEKERLNKRLKAQNEAILKQNI